MGSMHEDLVKFDQINSVAIEESGASGDSTVMEESSFHGSSFFNDWGQG